MSERGKQNRRNRRARREMFLASNRCAYCGRYLTYDTSTVDHVRARYWGGGDDPNNLELACAGCNRFKGDDPVELLACPVVPGGRLLFVFQVQFQETQIMSKPTFNYGNLMESQRVLAKGNAKKIHDLMRLTATNIVEIGKLLRAVHDALRDEVYQLWLRCEFGMSNASGWHYETAAERFGDVPENVLANFMPGAIRVLSNGKVVPGAIKEAVRRAEKGTVIAKADAVKIIRKHEPTPPSSPHGTQRSLNRFRAAIVLLLRLPYEERVKLADELVNMAARLRERNPQSAYEAPATNDDSDVDEPRPTRHSRRRALAIA